MLDFFDFLIFFPSPLWYLVWNSMPIGCASWIFLYFTQVVHLENLSMGLFKMYFASCWFFIKLNWDKKKLKKWEHISLFCPLHWCLSIIFSHFVHVGNFIQTTFSLDINVIVLWGIALAKGTMMIERVASAYSVASLGLLVPKVPWNHERHPTINTSETYRSNSLKLCEWCTMQYNIMPHSQGSPPNVHKHQCVYCGGSQVSSPTSRGSPQATSPAKEI